MRTSTKILIGVVAFLAVLFVFTRYAPNSPKTDPEAIKKTLQILINGNDAKIQELQDEIKKTRASSDCLKSAIVSYKDQGFQEILSSCQ